VRGQGQVGVVPRPEYLEGESLLPREYRVASGQGAGEVERVPFAGQPPRVYYPEKMLTILFSMENPDGADHSADHTKAVPMPLPCRLVKTL
jgi:hypothetical protein